VCTRGEALPGDAAEALRMLDAALDYLNGPLSGELPAGAHGEALLTLGQVSAKLAAARARVLSRFDASRGYGADGYGSSRSWLAARAGVTQKAAGAEVRRMRQMRRHTRHRGRPGARGGQRVVGGGDGRVDPQLPAELREGVDKLLVDTAAAGAKPRRPGGRGPRRLRAVAVPAARSR